MAIIKIDNPKDSCEACSSLSAVQIRLLLTHKGLRQQVEELISNSGSQEIKDYWEYSVTIERNHPLLIEIAHILGLSDSQLDDYFIEGAKL